MYMVAFNLLPISVAWLLPVACVEYALLHTLLVITSYIYDAVVLIVKLVVQSGPSVLAAASAKPLRPYTSASRIFL